MKNKILAIDDQVSICMIIENSLATNYSIVTKNNGQLALDWLEDNQPDLIICDVQMPIINGYQFLEKIRQRESTSQTPVIMLSGSDATEEKLRCLELGAQEFITKPFNPKVLEETVRKYLVKTQ
jgi:CheY-like chemotaxis protein